MISELLHRQAEELKQQGLYRSRLLADELGNCVNFSSNDYLSFKDDARIKRAFQKGYSHYPAGSGASMSAGGYHAIHQELEQTVAKSLGVDNAMLFSSGYAANLGVIMLLARLNCHLLIDKAVHASVYDGIKLANASYTRFLHNNMQNLAEKFARPVKNQIVLTESIFSMSGQQSPLVEITGLCNTHQTVCIVDEAHAFGILGPGGLGAVAQNNLHQDDVPLRIITFGKAMGAQGALVAGRGDWIDGLFQTARSHIYSTGISPAFAYGLLESFSIIFDADDRRKKLFELVAYFQQVAKKSPLKWRDSSTPVQQLQLGCPHKALDYATRLQQSGIHCMAMREPTVSRCDTGLRVVLNARHEPTDIDNLFTQVHQFYDSEY